MLVKVAVKINFVPFGSFEVQIPSEKEEDTEVKELEKRFVPPYELPKHTGAIRGPVTIWSTSA